MGFLLDSDFCVLKGIVKLRKKGIFAAALLKKRQYWPRYVDGETIKNHILNKEVGVVDARKGRLDDVTIQLHWLKEPNYTMMLMSSCGTLELMDEEKTRNYQENNQNIVKN